MPSRSGPSTSHSGGIGAHVWCLSFVNNVTAGALGECAAIREGHQREREPLRRLGRQHGHGQPRPTDPQGGDLRRRQSCALRRADGLQKLDDLNATVLSIAADAIVPVSEPMRLAEKLMAEVRVAAARGKRELTDEEVRQGVARLEGYEERGGRFLAAVLSAHQELDKLRALFNRSPSPSQRRCEQDIWITWMSHQDPGWGPSRWASVLGRPDLHARLIALGLATYDIGFQSGQPTHMKGGRLGVATRGFTDRVLPGGRIMSRDSPTWLRDASLNELPRIGQCWASVFVGAGPAPYHEEEY